MTKILGWLSMAAIFALVLGVFFFIYQESEDCKARGGVLVRAAFGHECLKATDA